MAKNKLKYQPTQMVKSLSQAKAGGDVTTLLKDAIKALHTDSSQAALTLASNALSITSSPEEVAKIQEILTEAHFRIATESTKDLCLYHLTEAIKLTPEESRLHFYLAITLLHIGNFDEAIKEFNFVSLKEPNRPFLNYLKQLALLAKGKKIELNQLALLESNTLKMVSSILFGTTNNQLLPTDETLGVLQEFWHLLLDMKQNDSAAPVLELQQIVNKGGYKKHISSILDYYHGVAALRADKKDIARSAWAKAKSNGFIEQHLVLNQNYFSLEQLVSLAKEEKWQELINTINSLPNKTKELDIVKELAGFAHYYLGYKVAEEGKWEMAARHWRKASEQNNSCRLSQNLALAEEALENWVDAAEAWRDMLKRRSRKVNTANYLSDSQVAAIWKRAAECYKKTKDIDFIEECATCLKNALKYAENDLELRIEIVDTLKANDQDKAAQNELKRILAIAPNNVDALLRLGEVALESYNIDGAIKIWKHILSIDPKNKNAKEALASSYEEKAEHITPAKERVVFLESALKDLPEHPGLLLLLAKATDYVKGEKAAIEIFLRAYKAAIKDIEQIGTIFHELVHIKSAGAEIEKLMLEISERPEASPRFWVSQGNAALNCQLGIEWGQTFFDHAIKLSEKTKDEISTLVDVCVAMYSKKTKPKDLEALKSYYVSRIERDFPNKGLIEFLKGVDAANIKQNAKEAQRFFKEAKQKAIKANETKVVERIKTFEELLNEQTMRRSLFDDVPEQLLERLMSRFPNGPPKNLSKLSLQDREDIMRFMELMGELPDEIF